MRAIVVIPARYQSSRFPGKPLVDLLGKPMVLWVAELSSKAVGKNNVYVATDDERIEKVVIEAGFQSVLTNSDALTGTDRLAEVSEKIKADVYVNVQGDEPLINPEDILKVINEKKVRQDEVINACCRLGDFEDPDNINIPKVIFNEKYQMVYMSRKALPGSKENKKLPRVYYKQVCIYAFTSKELKAYKDFGKKSILESYEDIEILRFLEFGKIVRMVEVDSGSLAVDVPDDVPVVEKVLRERQCY